MIDQIDGYLFDKPLLLIGEDGANLINRSTPIAFIARGKYWVNNHAHVLDGISEEFLRFIELYINAIDLKPYVTGTAQPKMNQAKMNSIPVALPPLAEQQRIVAKVDELMTLCDDLAAAQSEREARRDRLVAATLHRLTAATADDPTPFPARARFYFTHLPRLTTRPEHIQGLRQAILNLAVQGKLVPQEPHDEPASELFNRIQKGKKRTAGTEDLATAQYEIPTNWKWCRLAELSQKIHYGYTASANPNLREVRLLRITDIQNNKVEWEAVPGCEIENEQVDQYLLIDGDILIARTGGTVGKSFLVKNVPVKAVFASYLIRVQGSPELLDRYLKLFLESPVYWKQLEAGSRGTGQPNVNGQTLGNMAVPLPPLAEQQRIVARVDELLALCDALAANLDTVTATRRRLLEAALQEALAAA